MTAKRPFVHGAFTIERTYDASPERIFRAFSAQADRYRWFACHNDWPVLACTLEKAGTRTKMTFTEQGAFFWMENDLQMREQGTNELLDALGRELASH